MSFAVDANTGTAVRTGTLVIGGQTITVTQAAATATPACSYTVAPTSVSAAATGGVTTATVTASASCAWTAVSNVAWLSVASSPSGSGDGTVTFVAAAHTGTTSRVGTLTIAGRTVTVTQSGQAPTCSYAVTPTSATFDDRRRDGTLQITTTAGCAWTATTSASWITLAGSGSGTGSDTQQYTVASNNTSAVRTATITVVGQVVTITQAAK